MALLEKTLFDTAAVASDRIRPNQSLSDLRADSLDVVELVMELEDEFEIVIPDSDYEQLHTVGDAIRYIEHALNEPRRGSTQ